MKGTSGVYRISLSFNNTAGLGLMSCFQPRRPTSPFPCYHPTVAHFASNPSPQVALFLAHPRKRAEKEGCRSNAAEAGRA